MPYAVFPRGGGLSYTDGYLPDRQKAVIVDLLRFKKIIEINAEGTDKLSRTARRFSSVERLQAATVAAFQARSACARRIRRVGREIR